MKIALIQCPSWTTESPPYSLGMLCAILKKSGREVKCFDFNIKTFNYCKNNQAFNRGGINRDSWCMDQRGNVWYDETKVSEFIGANSGLINSFVNEVLGYGPRIIGFSAQSTSRWFSLKLASIIKEKDKNKSVIFGGPLVFQNCYGSDILKDYPFIDAVSFTEADFTFPVFLDSFDKNGFMQAVPGFAVRSWAGEIITGETPDSVGNLDELPFADYCGFNLKDYTKMLIPISTSRGCINRCTFCSESPHWRRYRRRSAQNILSEMKYQLGIYPHTNEFWFNDSLINGDIKMLNELCDLIISEGIKIRWGGQGMVRKEMTGELLYKMRKAGCYVISYGVESGSNKILGLMRKGYTAELAEKVIRETHELGIDVIFNIISGFPGEDEAAFQETKDFIMRCRKYASHIELPVYLLLKGSYIFNHLDEFGIAPINYIEDWQLKWKTVDNQNTYEIRKKRLEELECMKG